MAELSARDLRRVLTAMETLYRHAGLDEFPHLALRAVRPLVDTEYTSYSELGSHRTFGVADPPDETHAQGVPIFNEFRHQHPRVPGFPENGDGGALAISDLVPAERWRRTDLYQLYYKPRGIEDQVSVLVPGPQKQIVALAFNRSRRNFTAQELARLNLIEPHFRQAFENAWAVHLLREEVAAARGGLDTIRQGVVHISNDGTTTRFQSPRARQLIDAYLPEARQGDRLPDRLAAWILKERDSVEPNARRKLTIRRGGSALDLRLVRDEADVGWTLLLEERPRAPADPRVAALAPRLRQVLALLLEGLSEKEVAARLELRFHTVHGYVKELYRRMDVSSRGELMALWVAR